MNNNKDGINYKKIYIIATNNSTIVSRFFRLVTKEKYVHLSISLNKNCKKAYSFGRKYLRWPLPAGFINEDISRMCNFFSYSYCRIYEVEITNNQYYKLKSELKNTYIKNYDKFRYNTAGLPLVGFNLVYHRKYHYTCTSFCGKILMDTGIIDFKKDYTLIKPQDFFNLDNSKLIFEGKTFDYLKSVIKTF